MPISDATIGQQESTGDRGIPPLAVRKNSGTDLTGGDGKYGPLQMDSSGNLRVNVSAGGAGDGSILDGVTPSIKATVASLASSNPLAVEIVDGAGAQITSFGGGTQYADGAARGTATGTLLILDDGTNMQSAAGTTAGVLKVDVSATAANGTAIKVDASSVAVPVTDNSGSITVDQPTGTNLHTVIDSGTITTVTTVTGATINNAAGASAVNIQDGGNSITVDGTVTATIAASATTIAKAEDVASADADVGVPAMAIRKATPVNTSGLDGDYEMLQMSAGRLWTSSTIDAALPPGTNVIGHIIADSGSTTAVTGNVTVVQPTGTNLHAVLDANSGVDIGKLTANQSVNVAQVGGTNTVTGGVAGIIAVGGNVANAVTATANPVPVGGVFTTTPATLLSGQTATNQYTAAQNLKTDIATIAGTAPTTAGFVDIKGADGNLFVRQATATNLKTQANMYDGAGSAVTSNSATTVGKIAPDVNLLSILGTAPTTAGFIDVKGADGNVFVRQATATNLKAQANMYDGSGNAVTSNGTTTVGKIAPDVNILSILGTAPTTVGKIDVKGADGDVFVRQATGSNLHAVIDSGTVTANQGTSGSTDWRTDQRRGATIAFASIDIAAAGDNTIVAADATRKIKVLSYMVVADAAVTARWKSGAASNLSGAMSFAANGGCSASPVAPAAGHWLETAVNQALVINLGGAVGVRGHLSYFLEA